MIRPEFRMVLEAQRDDGERDVLGARDAADGDGLRDALDPKDR